MKNMICFKNFNTSGKSSCSDPLSRMRNSMTKEICEENGQEMLSMLRTKPEASSIRKQKSFDDMIQENLYINLEN